MTQDWLLILGMGAGVAMAFVAAATATFRKAETDTTATQLTAPGDQAQASAGAQTRRAASAGPQGVTGIQPPGSGGGGVAETWREQASRGLPLVGRRALLHAYEIMVVLDPTLDERTVAPSLETFLNVVRNEGGTVGRVDIWGRRRLAYQAAKHAEGIYAILEVKARPDTMSKLDRELHLEESVLRTTVQETHST